MYYRKSVRSTAIESKVAVGLLHIIAVPVRQITLREKMILSTKLLYKYVDFKSDLIGIKLERCYDISFKKFLFIIILLAEFLIR